MKPNRHRRAKWAALSMGAAVSALLLHSPALSLLLGIVLGLSGLNPDPALVRRLQSWVLAIAVVGLGAGLDFYAAVRVGSHGVLLTGGLLFAVFAVGYLLSRSLGVDSETATLISTGTAICGGSAIAAVAAVLKPKNSALSLSLAIVFLLNAVALVLLPPIGFQLGLSQRAFGWWAALAIHDTSSVVGATLAYGKESLLLGTTVKLARALWIVPVAVFISLRQARKSGASARVKLRVPWFIPGFLILSAVFSFVPMVHPLQSPVTASARAGFGLALFLVGVGVSRGDLLQTSPRALWYALCLWGFSLGAAYWVTRLLA